MNVDQEPTGEPLGSRCRKPKVSCSSRYVVEKSKIEATYELQEILFLFLMIFKWKLNQRAANDNLVKAKDWYWLLCWACKFIVFPKVIICFKPVNLFFNESICVSAIWRFFINCDARLDFARWTTRWPLNLPVVRVVLPNYLTVF